MGSVSQDLFLSPLSLSLSLSLSLNRTVTMFVLPRLPILLSIIFLGLFCLPHTVTCQKACTADHEPDVDKCEFDGHSVEKCWKHKEGVTCTYKCEEEKEEEEGFGDGEDDDEEKTYTWKLVCPEKASG